MQLHLYICDKAVDKSNCRKKNSRKSSSHPWCQVARLRFSDAYCRARPSLLTASVTRVALSLQGSNLQRYRTCLLPFHSLVMYMYSQTLSFQIERGKMLSQTTSISDSCLILHCAPPFQLSELYELSVLLTNFQFHHGSCCRDTCKAVLQTPPLRLRKYGMKPSNTAIYKYYLQMCVHNIYI